MTIPDYQSVMLPLLTFASDGRPHTFREAVEHLAQVFRLSAEERAELLPSGRQPLFTNRVGWASFYLKKAGLLEKRHRGVSVAAPYIVKRIDSDYFEEELGRSRPR